MKTLSSSSSFSSSSSKERYSSRTRTRATTRRNHFAQLAGFFSILLAAFGAAAQTTNALSDSEIQGRLLAQKLLEMRPTENFTNTGVLQIRPANGARSEIPVKCEVVVTAQDWRSIYEAVATNLVVRLCVIHGADQLNKYFYWTNSTGQVPVLGDSPFWGKLFSSPSLSGSDLVIPFAGSDFLLGDLGLEFFHWPDQKILRGDTASGRLCKVLESTNPDPTPNGYSRVDSWIDNETLGIVEAKAYDAKGKLLKSFYPKDFKKVNGQWQVGSMTIDNVQTRSRSRLVFDLNQK